MSKRRIRRIEPVQAGKVAGILAAALLLILFLPVLLLFSLVGLSSDFGGTFPGGGIIVLLFMPLIYGAIAFVAGMLYAVLYNFTFRFHGGVEMEYDDMDDEIDRIGA